MESTEKPKVVFTFVEAGMGHIVPATGAADAFEKKYGDKCEVVRWYIFRDSKSRLVRFYGRCLVSDTKHLHKSNGYSKLEHKLSNAFSSKINLGFIDLINLFHFHYIKKDIIEMNPDLMFSTYYSPSHVAFKLKRKGELNAIIDSYSPDPYIYKVWDRDVSGDDLFFVNNDMAYNMAISEGFKKENVKRVPYVLRAPIVVSDSKSEMRKRLGLKDRFTVVLVDGAYALGKLHDYAVAIAKSDLPVNVVAICGRNEEIYNKLSELKPNPAVDLRVLGFVKNIQEYGLAADLVVGKGGSNIMIESAHLGLPIVVNHYGGMLEMITAEYYCDEMGFGERIENEDDFMAFLKNAVEHPETLEKYREKCRAFRRDDGGEVVADCIFKQLQKKFPNL